VGLPLRDGGWLAPQRRVDRRVVLGHGTDAEAHDLEPAPFGVEPTERLAPRLAGAVERVRPDGCVGGDLSGVGRIGEAIVVPHVHPHRVVRAGEHDPTHAGSLRCLEGVIRTDEVRRQQLLPARVQIGIRGEMHDRIRPREGARERADVRHVGVLAGQPARREPIRGESGTEDASDEAVTPGDRDVHLARHGAMVSAHQVRMGTVRPMPAKRPYTFAITERRSRSRIIESRATSVSSARRGAAPASLNQAMRTSQPSSSHVPDTTPPATMTGEIQPA
jgi:hypothetical protein